MSTKWADNCDPQLPAGAFARAVLGERVESVLKLLPLAAHHYQEDIEHVHQLRVACRRASAALRAFSPLMRRKPTKLKQWLSRIRDAAGPARDIDVLLERFTNESHPDMVTAYAMQRLTDERQRAQGALVEVAKKASRGKIEHVLGKTLKQIKRSEGLPLDLFGHQAVRLAYAPFAELMHAENLSTAELHQFRIIGKRLRYSLEIFYGLFPAEMREVIYPIIEHLQARLGAINDHATAQALYQSWIATMPADGLAAAVARRIVAEHETAEKLAVRFTRSWGTRKIGRIDSFFSANLSGSVAG